MVEDTRVLKFRIGDEYYCVDISEITEVIEEGDLRTVPTAPEFSNGVRDYRENVIEVLDPKKAFDIRGEADAENYVIVLDPAYKQGERYLGWVVDEVFDVSHVSGDDVDNSVDGDGVKGAIQEEEQGMVVWLNPERLFEENLDYDIGE